jgi:hypothetical protein
LCRIKAFRADLVAGPTVGAQKGLCGALRNDDIRRPIDLKERTDIPAQTAGCAGLDKLFLAP